MSSISMLRSRLFAILVAVLMAAPLTANAASGHKGGVLATGFASGGGGLDYLKGSGNGFFLVGAARSEYRLLQFRSARDDVQTKQVLWQSFRFSIRDDHPRRRISFETALRGGGDLSRPGFFGEVLYAFVDIAPAARWASLRLGRQLLTVGGAEGLLRLDGAVGRFNLHHLGIEVFGGVPLRSRFVVVPESVDSHTGWGRDWTWGVAMRAINLRFTQLRAGISERFRDGELSRRQFTVDFHKGIAGRVTIQSELVADILQRRVEEFLVAVDVRPSNWLGFGVDYEHWHGSFGAEELFSVFATDPFDAVRGQVRLRPLPWLRLQIAGGAQVYPLAITRDNVPRTELGRVSGTQRFTVQIQPLSWLGVEVGERILMGTGGDKQSLHVQLRVASPSRRIALRLWADFQHYGFDLQPQLEGDYGSASVDLQFRPLSWMRLGVSGRAIFSPWLENQVQVAANVDFLLGVRRIPGQASSATRLDDWQPALAVKSLPGQRDGEYGAAGLVGGIGLGSFLR
jgi:hypothetical protein